MTCAFYPETGTASWRATRYRRTLIGRTEMVPLICYEGILARVLEP